METTNGLGELIRAARLRRGWTQEELAKHLGVKDSYISQWETGARRWPAEYIRPLSRLLGLSQVEMAVAAGLIDAPEVMPPRPRYDDDRLQAYADHWDVMTDKEKDLAMLVLDGVLRRLGEEGADNLVRRVGSRPERASR